MKIQHTNKVTRQSSHIFITALHEKQVYISFMHYLLLNNIEIFNIISKLITTRLEIISKNSSSPFISINAEHNSTIQYQCEKSFKENLH